MTRAADAPSSPGELRLHLGSGPHAEPGWVNVDKSWSARISRNRPLAEALYRIGVLDEQQRHARWPDEVIQRDLAKSLEWDTRSVAAIYSSHMLEHFERREADRFLGECLRVLRPGGVIRIALPNLKAAAHRYIAAAEAGEADAADHFINFLYLRPDFSSTSWLRRAAIRVLHRPHYWMYDDLSACALLLRVGFTDATPRTFREGSCSDLETLETRGDDVFAGSTFFVEAFAP